MRTKLGKLRDATDECIELSQQMSQYIFKDEAINWGYLGCREVGYIISDVGIDRLFVLIKEAFPDSRNFQRFIADELAVRGFDNVEVRTEW